MRTAPLYFGLFSATALFGAVAACSSTTTTTTIADAGTEGGAGGKDSGGGGGGNKDTGGPDEDSGGGTTDPDEKCAEEATLQACGQCCVTNHTPGYKVFESSLIACACKGTGAAGDAGDGPCATDCAKTICAATPAQPDAKCNSCLQASIGAKGDCQEKVVGDCQANADCVAQQKCVTPCQGKP